MALTLLEIQDLRTQGKYRETIAAVEEWAQERLERPGTATERGPFVLEKGWAHYQLGEYGQAEEWVVTLTYALSAATDMGESAWRLLAHCAERRGDFQRAETLIQSLPSSIARDNLWVTILVGRQRKGEVIEATRAVELALAAQRRTPYQTVDGHIVNNVAWLLYGAREQEVVKPFLPILPGLIEVAIGIYEATGTALNHLAGALFRASQICLDVGNWPKGALLAIEESIAFWEQLVASEGGEKYLQNLAGAQAQREKILVRLG